MVNPKTNLWQLRVADRAPDSNTGIAHPLVNQFMRDDHHDLIRDPRQVGEQNTKCR
jgi:hypothetical protein